MSTTIAIVVEWENALLCEKGRSLCMLAAIQSQIGELKEQNFKDHFLGTLSFPFKIYFLFDELNVARETLEKQVRAVLREENLLQLFFCPVRNKRYYELKNFGGKMADVNIIAFLDSDVIPQPYWLKNLLEPFRDGKVEVVRRNAFI